MQGRPGAQVGYPRGVRFWLVVHVLAAIAGIGPELAFGMMGPRGRRAGRQTASAVYDAIAVARMRVVYPALLLQIISGTALILVGGHSILDERWLEMALGFYAVAIGLVAFVLVPTSARARKALDGGTEPDDPSLRSVWKRQAMVGGIAGTLLIVVAVLMVWKPLL